MCVLYLKKENAPTSSQYATIGLCHAFGYPSKSYYNILDYIQISLGECSPYNVDLGGGRRITKVYENVFFDTSFLQGV